MSINISARIVPLSGTESYDSAQWESKKRVISDLYAQGLSQNALRNILAKEYDFRPTPPMLKKKIAKWKIDRKNKEEEILAAFRICLHRQQQGKKTSFRIRSRVIDEGEIRRYLRRKGIRDLEAFVASDNKGDDSALEPYTPPESPAPQYDEGHSMPEPSHAENFTGQLGLINHREPGSMWPTSAFEASTSLPWLGHTDAISSSRWLYMSGSLNRLTITEKLIYLNDDHHNILRESKVSLTSDLKTTNLAVVTVASAHLKTFTNGMWRGRDLLLGGRTQDAELCFNEAFSVVQGLLKHQDRKFLVELYEMILNFQLDESKDILAILLDYIEQMVASNNTLRLASWRIGEIGKCLKRMSVLERVETAECLLRNNLSRHDVHELHDAQEAQSIEKTIARSIYRRKPIDKAIVHLTNLLSTTSPDNETASYEQCGLYVELAQLHRFLEQPEEAARYLKLAWRKAFAMTEIYGSQFAREAADVANRHLGAEESLTSLVEAELAEVTAKMEGLCLEAPSTNLDTEAAFRIPATLPAVAS